MTTAPLIGSSNNKRRKGFRDRLYGNYTRTVGSLPTWSLKKMLWQYEQLWKDFLPRDKQTPILDVACGGGQFLLYLKNTGFTLLYGVDASEGQVAIAKKSGLERASFGDANDYLASYNSYFGVVSVQNFLEHLDRDELLNTLDTIHDALRDDGQVWIIVPNGLSLWGNSIRHADLTHETCYTPQSMEQALITCGFTDIEFREMRPLLHGVKSFVRLALWKCIRSILHLSYIVEFGGPALAAVYTHDMQVVAKKARKQPD